MKVSYKWLSEFVNIDIPYTELGDKFSLMSQEVADVYKLTEASNVVVGYVKSKEKHPDADKLNVCQVDVGEELQIVCGAPNVEMGQKVIVALVGAVLPGDFKIKKSKIRGIESSGMICSLNELGIDKKFVDTSGIHVLPSDAEIGGNPFKILDLDDEVLELDLTPNRGDLLSVMGVAYDTAAILDKELYLKEPFINEIKEKNPIKVRIETDNCMSYYARVIKDVKIAESPDWLKARLIASGIRPINNIVDITNYIMLETGQPLHAFDLEKFETNEVVVRDANNGEVLKTLDDQDRELLDSDIVITNGHTVTALGGVMGGANTQIDESTRYVLLESATFNPVKVRRTSRRLDLRSDSSMRFEKGVDPNRTILALDRASEMFQNLAQGQILSNVSKVEKNDLSDKIVDIDLDYIKNTVGYDYKLEEIEDVFDRLGFEYKQRRSVFSVKVPTRRLDILTKQDLVEEVVRIHGYDNVPLTLPKTVSKGNLTVKQVRIRRIRSILQGLGLDEVLTYSLVNEKNVYDFTLSSEEYTKLLMPMSADKAVMRHTPLNGIINTLKYNTARKMKDLGLFEISKKHADNEELLVSGALTGIQNKTTWKGNYELVDFFYTKGIVEALLDSLGVLVTFKKPEKTNTNYHPGQTAYIYQNDKLIGFVAKLHPKYVSQNDLNDTFVFEINLDQVSFSDEITKFEQLQKYPVVARDIAIVLDRSIPVSNVIEVIKKYGKKLLKDVDIFDVYTGENVLDNEKSIAIKLLFMDQSRTLETDEVTNRVNRIIKGLLEELDAKLRD